MVTEILTALCLVLVLEGILPFVNPDGYKQAIRTMIGLENGQLRLLALSSMIAGVVLLTIVR
jgi:uncharacterized protein YjeT (DUF2065 family)